MSKGNVTSGCVAVCGTLVVCEVTSTRRCTGVAKKEGVSLILGRLDTRSKNSKTNSQAHPGMAAFVHVGNLLGFNLFVAFDNMNTLGGGALKVHRDVINKND